MEQFSEEKYIISLIEQGEHQHLDFKFEISNARKIAKTLVAFANTGGGRLLIGVKDNGRIAGVHSEEEYYMIEAAAGLYCKPEIPFTSFRRNVQGKTILEVVIEPSNEKPHLARDDDGRWLAYHRVRDNNYLADYILLNVWKREKRPTGTFIAYSDHEKALLHRLSETKKATVEDLKTHFRWKKKHIQNMLINLISLEAVEMEFEDQNMFFRIAGN